MNRPVSHVLPLVALVLVSSVLTGCGATMVPFTHELRSQQSLSVDDVQQLQFYVSHTVTLRREVELSSRQIEGGNLKLRSGKTLEEVVVEQETPGIATVVNDTTISVSFEEGTALTFALRTGQPEPLVASPPSLSRFAEPPEPFPGQGPLVQEPVVDDSLVGSYWLATDVDSTTVSFQGKLWEAVEESFRAHLIIDTEELEDVVESNTVLKGRTIGKGSTPAGRLPVIMF
ncbi:MAG: DNA-directed RNA polymerase [Deltaproteobacteria bacterium]|nr:DNA-directed RNA polymerase [Deltaproteobacteria bacterium]